MNKIVSPTLLQLTSHKDMRGEFTELLRKEALHKKSFGQLSLTTINPKQEKGNHYHKIRWEWFYVIQGKADVELFHVKTHAKKIIVLDEKTPQILCIPPLWNHVLLNKERKEAIAVVYSSIAFKKESPDVFVLAK